MEQIVKQGTTWLETSIDTTPEGLRIYMRAEPRIEELIKSYATLQQEKLEDCIDGGWRQIKPEAMSVYMMARGIQDFPSIVDGLGCPLVDHKGRANLSFFRIVGISRPEGITMLVKGPQSTKSARQINGVLSEGVRDFVKTFLVPIHIELRLSSKEF